MFGASFGLPLPDGFLRNMLDTSTGKIFGDENTTDAERLASQVNSGSLVWNGPSVTAAAPNILDPAATIRILRPKSIKGSLIVQQASSGPSLRPNGGLTGQVAAACDGVGVGTDGCEPIQNNPNGKIALRSGKEAGLRDVAGLPDGQSIFQKASPSPASSDNVLLQSESESQVRRPR